MFSRKRGLTLFLLLLLGACASVLWLNASQTNVYSSISKNLTLFGQIYKEVATKYVDQIEPEEFLKSGIDGMLRTLDPYTTYIEPEDRSQIDIITHGQYGGVGITLTNRNNRITVEEPPFLGTPAARAGIREGDFIIKVNGKLSSALGFNETARQIRGPAGSEVTLTIQREGESKELEFSMIREIIKVEDVRYADMIDDGIGYILLTAFSEKAPFEVAQAISQLKARDAKGLILDLRSNPGGLLESAVQISDYFLPKNSVIVSTKGRAPGSDRTFKAASDPLINLPLIVLVNPISASASEIVAGALQDHDLCIVLGDTTFGKGLVQSVIPLSNSLLKITTAKYYTPSGRCIQKGSYSQWTDTTVIEEDSFHTIAGRSVHAGGGIAPDLTIQQPRINGVLIDLQRKSMFFNFAVHFAAVHPLSKESDFQVDDAIFNSFINYLKEKNYQYAHPFERSLDNLAREASEGNYGEEFSSNLNRIRRSLLVAKENMLINQKDIIKKILFQELSSKYFGTKRGIELGFHDDPVVQKAIELLHNRSQYDTILKNTR